MSPGFRAMLFGSFIFLSAGVGVVAALALGIANGFTVQEIMSITNSPSIEHVEMLKWMNNLSQVSTFLLPVGIYLFIFGAPNAFRANMPPTFLMVILGILWMIFSGGIIELSSKLNALFIPEGSSMEQLLKPTEEKAEQLTYMILNYSGIGSLINTIFCIAIIPAICEELAFRGVLQPLLIGATKNIHLGIWLSAIVFSFFHFQFYGFLPRMILGAMLGYLFVWSGSLWVSVLAHLANNAFAIIIFHYNELSLKAPEGDFQNSILFYIISIAIFFGILAALRSRRIPESGWIIES